MKTIIAVDPGKFGGIAILEKDITGVISSIDVYSMPLLLNKELDIFLFQRLLQSTEPQNTEIYLEDVHAIFGSSAKSTFNFGYICGQINTICCLHTSVVLVTPKVWQKEIWINEDIVGSPTKRTYKKSGLPIMKIDTKLTSFNAVLRLFPNVQIPLTPKSKKPHDGIIDALCIAEYGRRQNK